MDIQSLAALRNANQDLTDEEFLLLCNTPVVVQTNRIVKLSDVLYYMLVNGQFIKIIQATQSSNPMIQGIAVIANSYLNNPQFSVLNFDDPLASNLFSNLAAAGILTQEEIDTATEDLTVIKALPFGETVSGQNLVELNTYMSTIMPLQSIRQLVISQYNDRISKIDQIPKDGSVAIPSTLEELDNM